MRVSCSCPKETATNTLVENLRKMGVQPIITPQVVRAVYEGPSHNIGEAIVEMFAGERDHDINVQYTDEEQRREDRKAARKLERAQKNAKLHGH